MNIIKKLYSGRIGGLAFLIGVLLSYGGFVLQGKILDILPQNTLISILSILISLLLFTFFFSVNVRRWHDLNKSGWYSLLVFAPLVNVIVGIILIFKTGKHEENNYGKPLRDYKYLLQDLFALD